MYKINILPDDPAYHEKIKMVPLLENVYPGSENTGKDLVDLSWMTPLNEEVLGKFKGGLILVSPEYFFEIKDRGNVLAACPWRHWSVIHSLRQFKGKGDAGDLVSFRVMVNLPRKSSRGGRHFYNELLPEIIDLCCYIADASFEEIHINRVEDQNICFALIKFAGNIVAEIELNEALPDSMDPIRFVRAYFKEGVFTNMPLGGDVNVEGTLIATDDKVERFVHEHMDHDSGDELGNFYFRMMYDIVNNLYEPKTYMDFRVIQETIRRCLQDKRPCKITEATR